jgi:hypothetical protein
MNLSSFTPKKIDLKENIMYINSKERINKQFSIKAKMNFFPSWQALQVSRVTFNEPGSVKITAEINDKSNLKLE